MYATGPSDPAHLNNIPGAARLLGVGIAAIATQGPLASTLLNTLILDVLAQRVEEDEPAELEDAAPVVPAQPPTVPVPAKASRKRKQPLAAAGPAVQNGTLPAAQGDTGVPILATLTAAGGHVAGGHVAGAGAIGVGPAALNPIVSSLLIQLSFFLSLWPLFSFYFSST